MKKRGEYGIARTNFVTAQKRDRIHRDIQWIEGSSSRLLPAAGLWYED
jgi:hypothetical protein